MSIVLLWAGLAFIAVGASIVVLEVRAVRTGTAAEGRIAGYAERRGDSGPEYRAVIGFVDLRGRKRLIESPLGSNVPIGRIGDRVKVVQRADDPDRASVASRLTGMIGAVLALLGAACCVVFFATFRVDLFSVAASLVVTASVGVKLHALRARMADGLLSWRAIRDQAIRSRTIDAEAGRDIPWADAGAIAAVRKRQDRVNRTGAPLLVAAGAALILLAVHLQKTTSDFLAHAVPATGRIVDLVENGSGDDVTYAAMVEFEAEGRVHRFKDSLSANPPVYRADDEAPILYLPDDPQVARIDRGIWSRLMPAGVGLLGALLALAGLLLGVRAFGNDRRDRDAGGDPCAGSRTAVASGPAAAIAAA